METNDISAEHPAKMESKSAIDAQEEKRLRKCWHGCLIAVLVMIALFFLVLMLLPPLGQPSEHAFAVDCNSKLMFDWKLLRKILPFDKGDEAWTPPPDWTLVDLILESDKCKYPPVFRACFHIRPQTWIEKKLDRRESERLHYLVFPVSASAVFDDSLQPPVPIVMCPPGAHREFGTNVLYSDGTVKVLTTKEAEKLVAEQHPEPLELKRPEDKRESEQGDEEAEAILNRPGAE